MRRWVSTVGLVSRRLANTMVAGEDAEQFGDSVWSRVRGFSVEQGSGVQCGTGFGGSVWLGRRDLSVGGGGC